MDTGYIKLFRKMLDWEWYSDLSTFRLFTHLLLKVNYKDISWQGKVIERGSCVTSYQQLSLETGLTAQQVRTAIQHLISTNEITKCSTSKYTIIKVLNYDCYQCINKQDNKQITNNQQAKQQTNNTQTNKRITQSLTNRQHAEYAINKEFYADDEMQDNTVSTTQFNNQETVISTCNLTTTKEEKNKRRKEYIKEEKIKRRKDVDYQQIADMYNNTCVSFPRLQKLSDSRKKMIKARLNTYSIEDIQRAFELAEESDFLKGQNNRNWSATFDWMMKDTNLAKILEGNYANKTQPSQKKSQYSKGMVELPRWYEDQDSIQPEDSVHVDYDKLLELQKKLAAETE